MGKLTSFLFLLFYTASGLAQSVGIGTTTPDPSAALDIVSTTQGFLLPALTSSQRAGIVHPAAGLLVYQSDGQPGFYYFDGGQWVGFVSGQAVSGQGVPVVSGNYGLTYTIGSTYSFNQPFGIAVDGVGNVYISDTYNNKIRKMGVDGTVTTLAGSGAVGSADGQGAAASFNQPAGIAVDLAGNLYVADEGNNKIRKITSTGLVSTVAGSGTIGNINGTASVAQFYFPAGIAVDASGTVYVADTYNQEIRKISTDGLVSIVAGYPTHSGSVDGTGTDASFTYPSGIAVGADGNLYVADQGNNEIRKVTTGGVVTTLAVTGLNTPAGIATDVAGNLYVSEVGNERVVKVTLAGAVSMVSGNGAAGYANGPPGAAMFNGPFALAVDRTGNIYVADTYNNRIRKILAQ